MAQDPEERREERYFSFCWRSPRTCTAMNTMMRLTTTPIPPKVAIRPMSLLTAALVESSISQELRFVEDLAHQSLATADPSGVVAFRCFAASIADDLERCRSG
jgi:hypothetical protein